jgi:MFS family permease
MIRCVPSARVRVTPASRNRELWGFSPLVLTLVYATYAFGVLTTLVLAGRVSDEVGRRPVLLAALGTLMLTTVVFMSAGSVGWLFAARGLQGLATGLALGAASAAMLDLLPRRDPAATPPRWDSPTAS